MISNDNYLTAEDPEGYLGLAMPADLTRSLAGVRGTAVEPDLALVWDWESWWAQELEWRPSVDLTYLERVRAWYEASFREGLTVDFAHPEADLSRYRLIVVPVLYLTTERAAANLRRYAPTTAAILEAACACAGVTAPGRQPESGTWPPGVEVVRRSDGERRFTTLINHGETPATVQFPYRIVTVQPGDVEVLTG